MGKFGKRLLGWIIILVIVPLALVSLLVYSRGKDILRGQVYTTLEVAADGVRSRLFGLIEQKKNRVRDFSSDGFIRERLEEIAVRPDDAGAARRLDGHLARNKKPLDSDILDIFIFDRTGRPVAGTNAERLEKGSFEPEFFASGKSVATMFSIEEHHAPRHFAVSAPLTSLLNGKFIGVITVLFKASSVDNILAVSTESRGRRTAFKNANGMRVSIVDRSMTVISSSMPGLIGRHNGSAMVRSALDNRQATGKYTDMLGEKRIGATSYVTEPDWAIVVSFSEKEMLAPVNHLAFTALPFIYGGIVSMIAVAGVLSKGVTARMIEAASKSRRIAAGHLSERIEAGGADDEFALFATSFNKMVSNLMEREESLKKSENKYRMLLENLPQRVFLKDRNSTYISCNANYARDLHIEPDAIAGKTDYDFHAEALAVKYTADDGEVMKSGRMMDFEDKYVLDGAERFVHTVKAPVRNESGDVTGVLGIFWDVTRQKAAEEENARLQEQLIHMQKMEAIGQLTESIAHDFNNLLTAIIGNGYLIAMKMEKDAYVKPMVDQILAASEKATNLTRGLLAFGRKQALDVRPVALSEVVQSVEKLLARLLGEKIEFRTIIGDGGTIAMADFGRMEQVLLNLATNARDAMPAGGVFTIETGSVTVDDEFIRSHGYGKPGRYAAITATDTGVGIDEETRKRIFEPFFTTKDREKGTGLGLSIIYRIIKQHDGYIDVRSVPGRGAAFSVLVPAVEARIERAGAALSAPAAAGGNETILLAEDESEVRGLTRAVLEDAGYDVIEAADGNDAVEKFVLNNRSVRLLIFDAIMPGKNGREAYDEINALNPGIKTIFMSGYSEDIIHKSGILDEGLNFTVKPFVPLEFLKKVRDVLDG